MYAKENDAKMHKIERDNTVKPRDQWRKFSSTVITAEESYKIITASARSSAGSGGCGNAPGR